MRVPYAETSLYKVPEGVTNQQGVMLSDILPTGFEIGVQYGQVKPGDVVAVVGAGPVGLAVIATAGLYGAAQDHRGRPGRQPGRAGRRSSGPRTASTPATPTGRSRSWR